MPAPWRWGGGVNRRGGVEVSRIRLVVDLGSLGLRELRLDRGVLPHLRVMTRTSLRLGRELRDHAAEVVS